MYWARASRYLESVAEIRIDASILKPECLQERRFSAISFSDEFSVKEESDRSSPETFAHGGRFAEVYVDEAAIRIEAAFQNDSLG